MATQQERRAATTTALLDAARRLFGRHGFEQVAIDDIAARAGVTRGALYHYFESKESLFEAVFEQVESSLVEEVLRASADAAPGLDQLRAGCEAFIDATAERTVSRIALVDAPRVLGWARYRELDERYFLSLLEQGTSAANPTLDAGAITMRSRALLGALCELAIRAAMHPAERAEAQRAVGSLVEVAARPEA